VKISDLAENMIKLSGLVPYKDIDIKEIGLRPGEKLYEELLMKNEELDTTENNLIFIERDKPYTRQEVEEKLKVLLEAVEQGDNHSVREALRNTVPTYISNSLANSKVKEVTKEEMKGTVVKKIS
jgi:FlaA1/EpsC-like NDP-sugar epimerase